MFSLNIKPQYILARYFSFCVLLTVLLVTLSIRSLQGELFITDAQYMVAAGRWIIANGHLPTTDPLSIHSELTYICQQYPICILVAVLYDTFGEMSVRLFFALLDMVAVLFIWYQTFPKAGNRILHCAVSCVFGAVIVYSLRSTPRALDILCLAVSWELMEKYIKSRDIRFLFGFPFLGVCIANLHGALWPCAIMLPLAALLESKLNLNARIALAVTILLTIASAMLNPYGLDVLSLPFKTIGTSDIAAPVDEIENDLQQDLDEVSEFGDKNPLVAAAFWHARFEGVHAFADGNGRTGRAMMNYYLLLHNHPPIVIFDEDRKDYYAALDDFDMTGDLKPLIGFLRRETCKTWKSAVQREDRSHQMSLEEKRETVSRRVSLNEINHDFDVR